MSVALDNNPGTDALGSSVTTVDFTGLTVGTGSNRALVALAANTGGLSNISITWDPVGANQALTRIQTVTSGGIVTEVWGLVNPVSGNKILRASWTTTGSFYLSAVSFTGVDQTGGTTTFNNSTTNSGFVGGLSGTSSATVTTATSDAVVVCHGIDNFGDFSSVSDNKVFIDPTSAAVAGNFEVNGASPVTLTGSFSTGCGGSSWAVAATNVKASVASGPLPPTNYDWPNPRAPQPVIDTKTLIQTLLPELAGQDQFFGGFGQGPAYDYPNPKGPIRSLDLLSWLESRSTLFPIPNPLLNYDWPNPRGYLPVLWRTHTDSYKLTLIGQDQFFGGFGQGPTYDWPNPRGPVHNYDLKTWLQGFGLTEVTSINFIPFFNYDWPNPSRGFIPSIGLKSHIDSYKLILLGQDQFFGGSGQGPSYDYPNPRGPVHNYDLKTWLNGFRINLLTPSFINYDWPNPRGPVHNYDLKTWLNGFRINLLTPPFINYDWPNPKGPVHNYDLKTWLGFQINLPAPSNPSFTNYDWPNPRGYLPALWRTHTDSYKLMLIGQDQFFGGFGQGPTYDWPNPRGFIPGISLKTHTDSYKLGLIGQDQFFGGSGQGPSYDYPNPKGPLQGNADLKFWSVGFVIGGLPIPYLNYDWPVPKGAVPASELRTWIWKMPLFSIPAFARTVTYVLSSQSIVQP